MKTMLKRALLITGLLVVPTTTFAVTVKSKVANTQDLLNPVWNEAKDPANNRFDFREPASTVPEDVRRLRGHLQKELCIAVLQEQEPLQKKKIRVLLQGGRTSPVTIVVSTKEEIQFENRDPFEHNIYEVKGALGDGVIAEYKGPGAGEAPSRLWTPPGPGVYEIRDKLIPSLRSWVVVEPNVQKTFYPNRKGEFQTELDPGTYTLQAYFNGEKVGDKLPIEIKATPAEQTLEKPLKAGADKPEKKDDAKKDDTKDKGN
jgi:hypothetical protein